MKEWSLKRTTQCKKCPFKKSVNPITDIPNYDFEKHQSLQETIAKGGPFNEWSDTLKVMACHHSYNHKEYYCIGWLWNQLYKGNNIPLRFKMLSCKNIGNIKVTGEQHERFEDTIPDKPKINAS